MTEGVSNRYISIYSGDQAVQFFRFNRPFRPSYYAFVLIKSGTLAVRYKLSEHILHPNDVLLINPQVIYEFTSISEDAEWLLVVIKKDFKMLVPTRFNRLDTIHYFETSKFLHLIFSAGEFDHLWHLARIVKARIESPAARFKDDLIHTLFASIAYMIVERMGEIEMQQGTGASRSQKLTVEFVNLLQLHFRKHHKIEFYASRLNVSSKHLSESLKKVTGYTAREMINMALIREAKMLFGDSDLKVSVVSEMLGFGDPFSFSKFFKRMTALSPRDYVRACR